MVVVPASSVCFQILLSNLQQLSFVALDRNMCLSTIMLLYCKKIQPTDNYILEYTYCKLQGILQR